MGVTDCHIAHVCIAVLVSEEQWHLRIGAAYLPINTVVQGHNSVVGPASSSLPALSPPLPGVLCSPVDARSLHTLVGSAPSMVCALPVLLAVQLMLSPRSCPQHTIGGQRSEVSRLCGESWAKASVPATGSSSGRRFAAAQSC